MVITKDTTQNVRKWLKANGFSATCRLGKCWEYEPDGDIIYMPKGDYDTTFDIDFIAFLRELGLTTDFDCITLSLLHELGHSETVNDFDALEWGTCVLLKEELYDKSEELTYHDYLRKYWNIANEYVAQKWAVRFANERPDACQALENIFEKCIKWD